MATDHGISGCSGIVEASQDCQYSDGVWGRWLLEHAAAGGTGRAGHRDVSLVPHSVCIPPLFSHGSCESQEGCRCLVESREKLACIKFDFRLYDARSSGEGLFIKAKKILKLAFF